MKITEQQALTKEQQPQVINLWNKEYPDTLSYQTEEQFNDYLKGLKELEHQLLTDEQGTLQGWAITFEREGATWFAIILDSQLHGKGLGSRLLDKLKLKHKVLNGWVIDHDQAVKPDGSLYRSPLGFYLKNDFELLPGTRLELDKISAVKIVWQRH
ncbi:MAG: N-acetyltransferase [Taibaiella sp.]|nr:N-acetyltransferase [Taibaiella sp.]